MNIILVYFAIKYKGDWDAIFKALEEKEHVPMHEINALEKKIKNKEMDVITILDIDYPSRLKEAYKPPFVLWYKGDRKNLENKHLCITGDENNEISTQRIEQFVPEIEKSYSIATTSSKPIDANVVKRANLPVLYVLANGISVPYINTKIKDKDVVISEYPPEYHPKREHFANRNRIIAAFSDSLILLNSKKDSSLNSLVTNFLNLGKDIYCFPGNGTNNDGNSELIKQGANLITSIKDISS